MPTNYAISYPNRYPGTVLDKNNVGTGFAGVAPNPVSGGSGYVQADLEVISDYLAIAPRFGRTGGGVVINNVLLAPVERTQFAAQLVLSRGNLIEYANINSTALGIGLGRSSYEYVRANLEKTSAGWGLRLSIKYINGSGTHIGNINFSEIAVDTIINNTSNSIIYVELQYNWNTTEAKAVVRGSSSGVVETPTTTLSVSHSYFVGLLNSDSPVPPSILVAAYNYSSGYTGTGHPWYRIYAVVVNYIQSLLEGNSVSPQTVSSGTVGVKSSASLSASLTAPISSSSASLTSKGVSTISGSTSAPTSISSGLVGVKSSLALNAPLTAPTSISSGLVGVKSSLALNAPLTAPTSFSSGSIGFISAITLSGSLNAPSSTINTAMEILGQPLYRINAGSSSAAGAWQRDQYFSTSPITTRTNTVEGTSNQALYRAERYASAAGGSFSYTFPDIIQSSINLILRFSENFYTAVGQRSFNIYANGTLIDPALDVFALAGNSRALDRVYTNIPVVNNQLVILLTSEGQPGRPFIMGLDVYAPPPPDGAASIFLSGASISPISSSSGDLAAKSTATLTSLLTAPLSASSAALRAFSKPHLTPQSITAPSTVVSGNITNQAIVSLTGTLTSPTTALSSTLSVTTGTALNIALTSPVTTSAGSIGVKSFVSLNANLEKSLTPATEANSLIVRGTALLNGYLDVDIQFVSNVSISPEVFDPSKDIEVTYENNTPYDVLFNLSSTRGAIPDQ